MRHNSEATMQTTEKTMGKAIMRIRFEAFDCRTKEWLTIRGEGLIIHGPSKKQWRIIRKTQAFVKEFIRKEVLGY